MNRVTKWVPKGILEKYAILWRKFGSREITFVNIGENLHLRDKRQIGKVVSRLRDSGYLKVERDPIDLRRKTYSLVAPNQIIEALEGDSYENIKIPKISERELHVKIKHLLTKNGIIYIHEPTFSNHSRPDFLLPEEKILLEVETEWAISRGQNRTYAELALKTDYQFILMTEKRVVEGQLPARMTFLETIFQDY